MRELVSKKGNVGYAYDEGERPDFDEYISRLAEFGLPKDYLYESIYEALSVTDGFDYSAYDKERVERLGFPEDWLRRCGLHPKNMPLVDDDHIISICNTLKDFDESMSGCTIDFSKKQK